MSTNLEDYDFELPDNLIAQSPLKERSDSKLLVLNPITGEIEDKKFCDIINFLNEDDVLVMNNTRVIPARLFGVKEITNASIEVLLLEEIKTDIWEALVKPAKRIKVGDKIIFGNNDLIAECVEVKDDGIRNFKMIYKGIYLEILQRLGTMPLPPYIKEKLDDQERYQTVYSKVNGSAAAPTAGLHFTKEILQQIKDKNIEILEVTLHVGLGTFRPVNIDNILEYKMHSEKYIMSQEVADKLNEAKKNNKRIVAVGTTSTRVLEANFKKFNEFRGERDSTEIFIYPGYEFMAVDALITNFHLPKSTLLMLISALVDRETILKTYEYAVSKQYRFFSFGDSMFINKEKNNGKKS